MTESAAERRARRLGRKTALERIHALVDDGSFLPLQSLRRSRAPWLGPDQPVRADGDGLLCGDASVDGRPVAILAHDRTVLQGSLGEAAAEASAWLVARATAQGVPLLILSDSSGARVQEGVAAVQSNAKLLEAIALASGRIPLLCATFGLSGGVAGYVAALCDLHIAVQDRSFSFLTGTQVIQAMTGEACSLEDIGGTSLHATQTGLLHATAENEDEAIGWLRRVLGYLPQNAWSLPTPQPHNTAQTGSLQGVIPTSPRQAYNVQKVIARLFDEGSFTELSGGLAKNLVTGLARLGGQAVGVLASQPMSLGGTLDVAASRKGARMIRFCHAFNLPILTLVDSPGFFPGVKQEQAGLLLHGAKLISAYAEAKGSVPRIALILRKSCGAASVLASADTVLALPSLQLQAMGAEALIAATMGMAPQISEEARCTLEAQLSEATVAAQEGYVHAIVQEHEARSRLLQALRYSAAPRTAAVGERKLSNLPL